MHSGAQCALLLCVVAVLLLCSGQIWGNACPVCWRAGATCPALPLTSHRSCIILPCSPNLLASGGADGELCIWDVGNPLQPSLYPAMQGGAGACCPALCMLWLLAGVPVGLMFPLRTRPPLLLHSIACMHALSP